jgi:outer membrane protein assembly factor BamB
MRAMHDILILGIGGQVVGIDALTGNIRWQDSMTGGGYGEVALAANDEYAFASAQSAKLFCYRISTGELLWTATTSASGRATIVVEGRLVFVAKGGEVNAFDFAGERQWEQALKGKGLGRIAMGFPGNLVQADDRGSE